jgi:hypothetical protein
MRFRPNDRRDVMENYFYVEITGSCSILEKIFVVGLEYKFYVFYVKSSYLVTGTPRIK